MSSSKMATALLSRSRCVALTAVSRLNGQRTRGAHRCLSAVVAGATRPASPSYSYLVPSAPAPRLRYQSSEASKELHPHIADFDLDHPDCNVPPHIAQRIGTNLHLQPEYHPLCTIKRRIQRYFGDSYVHFDDLSPVVSTEHNFDLLCIPPDHVSRSRSDTYYLNNDAVLRTHTSAHQVEILKKGHTQFTVTGDVYRRDEIDSSHYPIFHQMEGVRAVDVPEGLTEDETREYVLEDLKKTLSGLARHLFGTDIEERWVDAYFPFTDPSVELEIWYGDEWLEVLGCGVVQPSILEASGAPFKHAWAFGLGLERLAMVLHKVPDIRLFWSADPRFSDQFVNAKDSDPPVQFQPYSKYPPCYKDVSFWLPDEVAATLSFHVNDLNEIVRQVAGDLVEEVVLVDAFTHPKTNRTSHCYRISYRSMDRSLTNAEIDDLQWTVRDLCVKNLGVELR